MSYFKKNSKNGNINCATLIKESDLRDFNKFLSENFEIVKYKGETKDGTEMKFADFNELLSYPNFNKRKLISLKIDCDSEGKFLRVKFEPSRYIQPETISYSLDYNDTNWGFAFEDKLIERLKEFKPWYNCLTYTNLLYGLPAITLIVFLLMFMVDYFLIISGFSGFLGVDYNSDSKGSSIVGVIWLIPIFLFCYLLDKVRNYLLPLIFIAIGRQKKEYEFRQKILYCLFGIVGLGIIANIISNLIMK